MEKFPDMQGKYREFGNFPPYYIRKGAAFCIVPPLSNLPKFPKIITGKLNNKNFKKSRIFICN